MPDEKELDEVAASADGSQKCFGCNQGKFRVTQGARTNPDAPVFCTVECLLHWHNENRRKLVISNGDMEVL